MAELRSFIIGVTIAAVVLGIAYVAFGMGGDDNDSPTIRQLTTPTAAANRTTTPTNTRPPNATTGPTGATGAALTQPPAATQATAPTATRTAVPIATATTAPVATQPPAATATPAGTSPALYGQRLTNLQAQVQYAQSQANAPNPADAGWKQNSITAAQNIQALAASLTGAPAPACASSIHGTVTSGANTASAGATSLINGANSGDTGAISSAAGQFATALQSINAGITGVNNSCG